MTIGVALVSLGIMIGFVIIGGLALLLQREWDGVPEPLRAWLLARTHGVNTSAPPRRRARRVDPIVLCRISPVYLRHQRRFAAEMKRETKPEILSLIEARPAHEPQMLALAQFVRAKLVTQGA